MEDIEAVEAEYRGSPEEKADVLRYYTEFKGNMEKVSTRLLALLPAVVAHVVLICATCYSPTR